MNFKSISSTISKNTLITLILSIFIFNTFAQNNSKIKNAEKQVIALVADYALSRETRDTLLLRSILTPDIDQLVSSGIWRNGIDESLSGMLKSSENNAGKRTLIVERVRFLNTKTAIADARYEIENQDGTSRKMWSTFIAIQSDNKWKISAIRNMLPAKN